MQYKRQLKIHGNEQKRTRSISQQSNFMENEKINRN